MKKLSNISSTTNSIICPCCGINELERSANGVARCNRCDRPISKQMLETIEQIPPCPMPSGATPVSVATPRCSVWPTVFCGVHKHFLMGRAPGDGSLAGAIFL